jgi:F1F0 ATPase subunit 2
MTELFMLALDLTAGLLLGAIFFGGLWWTVRRVFARAVGPWLLGSFLVRTMLVLAGFYGIAHGTWFGVPVGLVGFLAARIAVTRFTQARSAVGASAVP